MQTTKYVTYSFVAVALAALTLTGLLHYTNRELTTSLEVKLADQERVLTALAELTNQYRADEVTESIIRDCSADNRARFEVLLNRLASLTKPELVEIEPLFDACASFFAERKALSVARFEEEYREFSSYLELYGHVAPSADVLSYQADVWQHLVLREQDRRDALTELVSIQRQIIDLLKATPKDNNAIQTLVVRAQQVQERTARLNGEVNELRLQVISL